MYSFGSISPSLGLILPENTALQSIPLSKCSMVAEAVAFLVVSRGVGQNFNPSPSSYLTLEGTSSLERLWYAMWVGQLK